MQYSIKHRYTGEPIYTAEIDDTATESRKLRLAVLAAAAAGANLSDANLAGAYLADAYLAGAYLADTNLADTNLAGAYLADTNLAGAYLARAYLARANLAGTNLARAYLAGVIGNMREIKSAQFDRWPVTWVQPPDGGCVVQIGCQRHPLAAWEMAPDEWIDRMDHVALDWWRKYRDVVLALVKASPAVPYGSATDD